MKYLLLLITVAFVLSAPPAIAASADNAPTAVDVAVEKNPDPFEGFNRKVYRFNTKFDEKILKPVATRYVKHVPPKVRRGVRNFVANLREPSTIINDLLQGKVTQAGQDTLRFLINSTFGVLGVFDVASHLNMPRNKEDFGQTLGKWGVPPGPYLMLPFLGPSNVRDATGLLPAYLYTDLTSGISDDALLWTVFAARTVDLRAELLSLDRLLESQIDPYVFLRESYSQRRIHEIADGEVESEDDDLLDELLEQGD